MRTLKFYGSGDDTFGEYGITNQDCDNCASEKPIQCIVDCGEEGRVLVVGQYSKITMGSGSWLVGLAQVDEYEELPNWNFRLEQSDCGYSPALLMDLPAGFFNLEWYIDGKRVEIETTSRGDKFMQMDKLIHEQPTVTTWIPCSRKLPPQPKENPVFENKPLELYLVSVENDDYPFRAYWNGKFFTDGFSKVEAIAWQPLPEVYKPTKENEILQIKEVKLYLSDNEQFVFDTKEECQHYNSFGVILFDDLFLEVGDSRFVLLSYEAAENDVTIYLQELEIYSDGMVCSNHDNLWKITSNLTENSFSFEMKDGTYDYISCDIDYQSANEKGWYPYWQQIDISSCGILPQTYTKEHILNYIKECFFNSHKKTSQGKGMSRYMAVHNLFPTKGINKVIVTDPKQECKKYVEQLESKEKE